jgi:DNA-binding response OmpR family regulator
VPGMVGSSPQAARPKVLIVALELPLRMLHRFNLEVQGLSVIEAEDGFAGLELARRERPDLILLDVMMRGLDGWQLAEELRQDRATRHIPFLFVTARLGHHDQLHGFKLGAVDYILLPCDLRVLASRVRQLVEQTPEELQALRDANIACYRRGRRERLLTRRPSKRV